MASTYDEIDKAIQTLLGSVDKELKDIRKCKDAVQQKMLQFDEQLSVGQYIRDDRRIVISAPEIIIGDVYKDGTLRNAAPSKVVIRSNAISLEAPDKGQAAGTISNKATRISHTCLDPGVDGLEEVVGDASAFTVQAQGITLRSESTNGAFSETPGVLTGEVSVKADSRIHLDAIAPRAKTKERIDALVKDNEGNKKDLNDTASAKKKILKEAAATLTALAKEAEELYDADETLRSEYLAATRINEQIKKQKEIYAHALSAAFRAISQLAEVHRTIKCLNDKKDAIGKVENDPITGTSVDITAERTTIRSVDEESKVLSNAGAGVEIQSKDIKVYASDEQGATLEDGSFDLTAANIKLSATSPKREEKTADIPATGNVCITSKNITMEAVDYEFKDEKTTEKALTEGGAITMRAETISACTNDTEGAGKGKVSVNSKAIALRAMDLDKESRADKELTKESTLSLLADKIYAGSPNKDTQTQSVQIASDKVGIFAKTTAEVQQDEAKAALQLDGGNIALTGSKTTLFGETTVNGKTSFKADVTSGKLTVDNIEIKSSFKSPCTSEGIAVPASPSSDSLSAKLQVEEAPKEEAEKK